jgi:DNA end-binding protein Ku
MAAPRTYWKGQLRLSLVSIDVALTTATEPSATPTLNQIHKPTGKRIRYQKVAPGEGPVAADEIVRGASLGDDRYAVIEPEELDEIKLESRHTIRLAQFVEIGEIDPRYFEKPYYVTPQSDAAAEGFAVIREALRKAGRVGLGQMTLAGRERLIAIRPCGPGLLLETLRYAGEVRAADRVFDDIPDIDIDQEMMDLALELIERKSEPFQPERFRDRYAEALQELIERKREGKAVVDIGPAESGEGKVVDLMAALKRSLGEGQDGQQKRKGGARKTGTRKTSGTGGGRARSSGAKAGQKSGTDGKREAEGQGAGAKSGSRRKAG